MANINAQHFCGTIDCDDYIRDECKRTTPNSWSDSLLLLPSVNSIRSSFSGFESAVYVANNGIGTSQMMAESIVMAIGEPSLKVPQCLTMPPSQIITPQTRGGKSPDYVPFPTDNAIWSVNDTKYGMFGDTIIDGIQYAKVYRQTSFSPFEFDINNAEYFCAIRNDIENKQVYGIYREQLPVINAIGIEMEYITKELLLYDFSLNVGETIEVSSFECADLLGYIQCGRFRRVDDISLAITNKDFIHIHNNDSIVIMENGEQRKRILMEAEDLPNATHFWVEGIGSSNGPMNFFIPGNWEESMRRLLCFSQNDELLFSQDYYEYDDALDCFSLGRGSGIDESSQSDIYVYPNPANDNLTISLAGNYSSIEIYDSFGRIMTSRQVNVTTSQQVVDVDISEYPSGLYFVIVKGDGERYYERIVKN